MQILNTNQIKNLDRLASTKYGISSLILMENAGRGIADLTEKVLKKKVVPAKIVIVCGKGNNGGDGFVAARHLYNRGHHVSVYLLASANSLKGEAKTNFWIIKKMNIPTIAIHRDRHLFFLKRCLGNADIIIDGIFGIGLSRLVDGIFGEAINLINESKTPVLAIDVPSGLNSDNGKVMGISIKAKWTAALGFLKKGLFINQGPRCSGKIEVLDISIPRID